MLISTRDAVERREDDRGNPRLANLVWPAPSSKKPWARCPARSRRPGSAAWVGGNPGKVFKIWEFRHEVMPNGGILPPPGVIIEIMAGFVTGNREAMGWMKCCILWQSLKKV